MLPRRLLLLLAAGMACAGAIVLAGSRASAPEAPVRVCASAKPFGPVALALLPAEATASGQPVRVTLRPSRHITRLTWHWELSTGVTLLQGGASGEADPSADVVTTLDALLLPPPGGRPGNATLVVEAQFEGADVDGPTGTETAIQSVELTWGTPPSADARIIDATDPLTGEPISYALMPSTQRPGR